VLVLNGDSYCSADLRAFHAWHRRQGARNSLVLTRVADTTRYGRVLADFTGRIRNFEEKGARAGPGWINAGIYLLNCDLILTMPLDRAVSLEREVFPAQVVEGLHGYRSRSRFLDIGTPESYAAAEDFFAVSALR